MVANRKVYPDAAIPQGGAFGGARNHRGLDHSAYWIGHLGLSMTFTPWAEGEITAIRNRDLGIYGKYIEVRDDEGYYWSYCHAAKINSSLKVGDRVTFDTELGVVGSTGTAIPRASKAGSKHLHTGLSRHQGAANLTVPMLDPLPHINARRTALAGGGTTIPIATPETDVDTMGLQIIRTSEKDRTKVMLTNGFNFVTVDPAHASFITRWVENPGDDGSALNASQTAALKGYVSTLNKAFVKSVRPAATSVTIDYAALATQVASKIKIPATDASGSKVLAILKSVGAAIAAGTK